MLILPVDGHVVIGVDAVLAEQIAQRVLGRGALARGNDGLPLQVGDGLHGAAVFHDVENAQRVHGQYLHRALGLAVEHGGEVRGDAGHVQLALDERGRHLIGGAGEGEVIGVAALDGAAGGVLHELDETHGGGALERGDAVARGGGFRGLLLLLAAGREREDECQRQAQGKELFDVFHACSSFLMLPSGA